MISIIIFILLISVLLILTLFKKKTGTGFFKGDNFKMFRGALDNDIDEDYETDFLPLEESGNNYPELI